MVAIIDPRAAWCARIAELVVKSGSKLVHRWAHVSEALATLVSAPPAILLLSRHSSRDFPSRKMLWLKQRTAFVLIVDPDESIAAGDLPGAGFDALLASNASAESMASCFSCLATGHAWLDPILLRSLTVRRNRPDWNRLSAREQQVARLAAAGLSNKRIARTLRLSDGTVKIHMHHILSKLDIDGREALIGSLSDERSTESMCADL
jgi:two-component system nitrate/nitrite response regulator NarP